MRALLALPLLALPAFAADILVPPGGSIQAAIDAAGDGDRVLVAAGTYSEVIDFKGKKIEVIGLGGPKSTIIDATGLLSPVVTLHLGEGPDSKLRGFTITGGDNVAFANGGFGGGVSAFESLTGVTASPTIEDCIFHGNASQRGGGVAGNATIRRCSFYDNFALYAGGGAVWGAPTMQHCVVASNIASRAWGGGIYIENGDALIEDTVIVGNFSTDSAKGGGIYAESTGTVRNCVIAHNEVDGYGFSGFGGGIFATTSLLVERCAVIDNSAIRYGFTSDIGGISGPVTIINSIVRGNTQQQLFAGATATYSNVEGGAPGAGNIDIDPLFVDASLAVLDYHLEPGSPCIDTGHPSTFDPDGSVADMGAFPFASFYPRANTIPSLWQDPGWPEISILIGGTARYRVHSTADAGNDYMMLGSVSGTSPGIVVGGLLLPLNPDVWFVFTAQNPNTPPLADSLGILDGAGSAEPTIVVPPDFPALSGSPGFKAWHAAVVGDSASLSASLTTNASTLDLLP